MKMKMKVDYLAKVGAAFTAFFTPYSDGLIGGKPAPTELATVKSVAIIGAGAGGTSTAYFLNNYLQPPHLNYKHDASITIFEQSDKIGGRCSAFHVKNPGQADAMVEVGASIFVKVNHHLVDTAKELGLEIKPLNAKKVAIWNGSEFVFEESPWKFWSIVKGLRRWGLAPLKLQRILKKTLDNLLESYTTPDAFDSIAGFAERFNLHKVAAQFTDSFLDEQGVGKLYSQEIVEVATRVNYGSNLNEIHALGALVTMAADDALQIKGGNFQIFEGMVGKSQANVRLNTKIARVRKLVPEYEGADPRFEVITTTGQKEIFDHVVIAAPIESTNIAFDLDLPPLPKVNYRTIHATFVRGHVNPNYFHAASDNFPTHILTTNSDAEFTLLTIQVKLSNGETVTKIFSPKTVEEDLLDRLYTNRTWVKRKEWKAYPELAPIPELNPSLEDKPLTASEIHQYVLKQHLRKEDEAQKAAKVAWGQVEIVPGMYYVNAFEPLISTMETETIAGKNVARLLRDKILGYCPVEKFK